MENNFIVFLKVDGYHVISRKTYIGFDFHVVSTTNVQCSSDDYVHTYPFDMGTSIQDCFSQRLFCYFEKISLDGTNFGSRFLDTHNIDVLKVTLDGENDDYMSRYLNRYSDAYELFFKTKENRWNIILLYKRGFLILIYGEIFQISTFQYVDFICGEAIHNTLVDALLSGTKSY